jgi:hypothetical protein
MSVIRRVKLVRGITRICESCKKVIVGEAIKYKPKNEKVVYYHTEGCWKGKQLERTI